MDSHKPCADRIRELETELARERHKRQAQHRTIVRQAETIRSQTGQLAIARVDRNYDV